MFGMFHRRSEEVRALDGARSAVPAAAYERLATFVRLHARRIQLGPEDKAALLRLAAHPPAWTNRAPALEGPLGFPTILRRPQPFDAMPMDRRAAPPSVMGPDHAPGGPAW